MLGYVCHYSAVSAAVCIGVFMRCLCRDQVKSYCDEKLMPRVTLAHRNEGELFFKI